MLITRRLTRMRILLAFCMMLSQPAPLQQVTAQDGERQRDIKSTEATEGRQQGNNNQQAPGRTYLYQGKQGQFPRGTPPIGKVYITIGVTLWRVRLATEKESKDATVLKERMKWKEQEREVVVTRISDENPVTDQDLIQMSIEYLPYRDRAGARLSNRKGYLYVIDREQFRDGSLKNAQLIFPTLRTYQADNLMLPGKTVTLPDPKRPFEIKRSSVGQAQTHETYTIILSPVQLDGELPRALGWKEMNLSPNLVAGWERQWNADKARIDMRGGVGLARSQRELSANGDTDQTRSTVDSDKDLTRDDLPPQIVFRSVVKPGATMLITIRLPFKEAATKPGGR